MKITIETVVKANLNSVWDTWNNPEDIKQWNTAQDDWHTMRRPRTHWKCSRLAGDFGQFRAVYRDEGTGKVGHWRPTGHQIRSQRGK